MGEEDFIGVMEVGVFKEIGTAGIAEQGNIIGSELDVERLDGIKMNLSQIKRKEEFNDLYPRTRRGLYL